LTLTTWNTGLQLPPTAAKGEKPELATRTPTPTIHCRALESHHQKSQHQYTEGSFWFGLLPHSHSATSNHSRTQK